jgi:tetratricopeptide (TPR) repeat protein
MRVPLVSAAVLTALSMSAPSALAAEPSSGTRKGDSVAAQPLELARVRYRQGVDAYKEGRFREAIDLFLEADELSPSAALSFNIAAAYEKIAQPASALRWYRDYLRRAPDAADRSQVEALVTGFEQGLAKDGKQQLTVTSAPPGAALTVDGSAVGITPWTGEIAPGSHRLDFRLSGREPASRALELPADRAIDVAIELAPAAAPSPAPSRTDRASANATPSTPPKQSDGSSTTSTLGWVGIATGGAALGGALVFELLRRGAESSAEQDRTQIGYADKLDTMHGYQTTSRVLLGVGAGLAVAGGVLVWLGRPKSTTPAVGIGCLPSGCGSTVRGSF